MAGRPRGNAPRTQWLRVRLTPAADLVIESARGGLSRSDYVRTLIEADAKKKGLL